MVILHYDFCALLIYLLLIFSMLIRKVVKGHTNKAFFYLLISSGLATIADIFSESQFVDYRLRIFFDYLYFTTSILIPFFYTIYVYATAGLFQHLLKKKHIWYVLSVPMTVFIIVSILNIFTSLAFTVTPEGQYIRGPLQPVLIACINLYNLSALIVLIYWRKVMPREKLIELMFFFPLMIIALILQQKHQGLNLTMFALSLSELLISFTVQRVDESFDPATGTKTFESAIADFSKLFLTKQASRVIFIKLVNYNSLKRFFGTSGFHEFMKQINLMLFESTKKYASFSNCYYVHDGVYEIKVDTLDTELVVKLAEEIAHRFEKPVVLSDITIYVESKICIARLPEDINNLERLMNFRLNFHTKLPDTKQVMLLSSFIESKEFKIKNELEEIINRALKENNFKMYYQPIYSAKEKKFVSAEALIRLEDPVYGFVSPSIFIPAAEANGAIHNIGDFVIDSVCNFVSRTDFNKLGLEYIELNLSVAQCIEDDLVQKFDTIMEKYKVIPSQLNLEITETAEGFDPAIMDMNINILHEKGFKFSLDDYGTGYSNIKRVTDLPLDIVKLDKSFVDEMDNPQMWSVIVNTVRMFKEMDKIILVEGVENEKTLDSLLNLGCDYIQGFYFSKPLPEEEFIKFIQEKNKV